MDDKLKYTMIVLAVAVAAMVIVRTVIVLQGAVKEFDYLNHEIARTTGEEQKRWKRRKRSLLLSLIPIVGRWIG